MFVAELLSKLHCVYSLSIISLVIFTHIKSDSLSIASYFKDLRINTINYRLELSEEIGSPPLINMVELVIILQISGGNYMLKAQTCCAFFLIKNMQFTPLR